MGFTPDDPERPWWRGYRELLEHLGSGRCPAPEELNTLLPPEARNANGQPLRFVPAERSPGTEYERRIFETGEVPTRMGSRHDLYNALTWCRWPRLKAAMNAQHYTHIGEQREGRRGPRRDVLAHLDESGAIVISRDAELLQAIAERNWNRAFLDLRESWRDDTRVHVCGHGLMEKFLRPYKAITAHSLLLLAAPPGMSSIAGLDRFLGQAVLAGKLLRRPPDLGALPLMGIPGWWPKGPQDRDFHDDRRVFRAPPVGLRRTPVTPVSIL